MIAQLAVGAVLRHPEHVIEELVAGIGAEVAARGAFVFAHRDRHAHEPA